ncbi:MAG: hypothetical protein LBH19_00260 [Dysgonamonadaceae bacterium]|jgi:hypothetical protein|nr:hypothetical protein [Dysgonamonadaceae bacterium]
MNISWIKSRIEKPNFHNLRAGAALPAAALITFACFSNAVNAQTYALEHKKDCGFALHFFAEHKTEFEAAGNACNLSGEFLFAIVAPEISQFSYVSNKAETYSLKVFYVQNGSAVLHSCKS